MWSKQTRDHNILDLVFTTNPDKVSDLKIQNGMSDRDAIIFDINLKPSTNRKQPSVHVQERQYRSCQERP